MIFVEKIDWAEVDNRFFRYTRTDEPPYEWLNSKKAQHLMDMAKRMDVTKMIVILADTIVKDLPLIDLDNGSYPTQADYEWVADILYTDCVFRKVVCKK